MVDVAISTTVPICVFNPHSYLVVIRQDSMLGQVELVEVVSTISRCENPNERDNFSAARRVLLRERSVLPDKASKVTEGPEGSFVQKIQEPLALLPEHLTELYEGSADGKTKDEKREVYWLLLKHQGVFCQNENVLGISNLVEHTIDTDDVKAMKQPSHHLLMAFTDKDQKVLAKLLAQGVI